MPNGHDPMQEHAPLPLSIEKRSVSPTLTGPRPTSPRIGGLRIAAALAPPSGPASPGLIVGRLPFCVLMGLSAAQSCGWRPDRP